MPHFTKGSNRMLIVGIVFAAAAALVFLGFLCAFSGSQIRDRARMPESGARVHFAGLRASNYGIKPFPDNELWDLYAAEMEELYPGSVGSFVWIAGTVTGTPSNRICTVNYPLGNKAAGVNDFPVDMNADFLELCDRRGYAVWIQVEPGDTADLAALAEETMKLYKHHPSVRGFGVDVEWYKSAGTDGWGTAITDDLAKDIDRRIKKVDKRFSLFLKHWDPAWMPPTYRSDIIFVNDSQYNGSLEAMKETFDAWSRHFYPNPVMYQIGYESDEHYWGALENPLKDLGMHLAAGLPDDQSLSIIWVDFTLRKMMARRGVPVNSAQ
ncbi:hypothetical protein K7J14_04930 [Treponema zuelzerae]|uniref:Uncharacterized protein n=1 Tax=Teretinema zuelzerae TaxID=156 RepID=A0AAE3JHL6_9SPIR|nr:hypothetical protein [Teretinema zuelzerae]MCD1654042.1 hypothetical protein [Teretinema zuelzerae]